MTCEKCRPLLSLYHDGQLTGPRSTEGEMVRAHLADCPACAAILAGYRQDEARIAVSLTIPPSARLRASVLAATIHSDTAGRRTHVERSRRSQGRILFGGLAGGSVAVVAVLLLALMSNLTVRNDQRTQQIAAPPQAPVTALAWVAGVQGTPATSSVPRLGAAPHSRVTVSRPDPVAAALTPRVGSPLVTTSSITPAPVDRATTIRLSAGAVLSSGAIRDPLWSPDSRSLLYLTDWAVDPATGWFAGTLMRYGPSGTVQLATQVRRFDWSPDGRSVAYATEERGASDNLADSLEADRLHVVGADGKNDRMLTGVDRANVEWFADGIAAVQDGTVVHIQPTTGQATPLTAMPGVKVADEQSAFYALSADQQFFAYQDGTGLRIWNRDRSTAQIIFQAKSRYMATSFHFSWDGNTIFYSVFDGKNSVLYRQVLSPLGQPTALNNGLSIQGPVDLVGPTSADGAVLNFRTGTGANTRNYLTDTQSGSARLLPTPGGVGPVGWWSPDGRRMVYVLYQGDTAVRSGIARVSG
jgi:Tol biopolymer transport system component/anti-sigma factor RsiW